MKIHEIEIIVTKLLSKIGTKGEHCNDEHIKEMLTIVNENTLDDARYILQDEYDINYLETYADLRYEVIPEYCQDENWRDVSFITQGLQEYLEENNVLYDGNIFYLDYTNKHIIPIQNKTVLIYVALTQWVDIDKL